MTEKKKKIRAFIGFQIESNFHSIEDIKSVITRLEKKLIHKYNVILEAKYGIFPVGGFLWNDIRDSMYHSDVAIFDISENNPNVMIELGLAYGFGKQVFILKNKESFEDFPLPSDLSTIYIPYDNKNMLRKAEIINQLEKGIIEYLKKAHKSDYYFKSLWGFEEYDSVLIICSELDEPESRQYSEPKEYIYLSKYGDVDSLVEVLVTMHRLYPHLEVEFHSANEAKAIPEQYTGNIILIGGPDYNRITKLFQSYCPYEYLAGEYEEDISIKKKNTGEVFTPKIAIELDFHKIIDYGFFMKRRNPYNSSKKLIMIGGSHTYGVFGASKAFSYWGESKEELSYQNCKDVINTMGDDPEFCILFDVHGIESSVLTPKLNLSRLDLIKS